MKLLLSVSFFLLSLAGYASDLSNTGFQHISTEHGLSQKTVQAIYQDKHDFLWLGTQEGLNRYDGRQVKVFRHSNNDKNSLSNDFIRDILEDKQGNLWIATGGGLNRFVRKSQSFQSIKLTNKDGNNVLRINSLFVDNDGIMWLGTGGDGLFWFDPSSDNFQINSFDTFDNLRNTDVRVVFEDSRGRLWIGTDGNGVSLISSDKKQQQIFLHNKKQKNSLSHNRIRSISEDHKGQIWIGSRGGGASRFDELSKVFKHYLHDPEDSHSLSNNRVYKIFEDNTQRLWIATDAGLSVFQPQKDNFIRIQHHPSQSSSLNHNRVLSIYQDSGNLIWFGTSSGLNQWNPISAKFVHYRHISENDNSLTYNHVHGFAENSEGIIYVATFGGGLNYFDPEKNLFNSFPTHLDEGSMLSGVRLTTLMVDTKQQIWVGTLKGVDIFSQTHEKLANFHHDSNDPMSLSDNGVTDILQDSDGEFWISTYRAGLNRMNSEQIGFTHYRQSNTPDGLNNENIFQIMQDDDGYIWLATDGGGISRLDKHTGKFVNFKHDPEDSQSLSGNTAWSIYQDSKGRFWIGIQGNGLDLWEPEDRRQGINRFKHYTVEGGLNSSTVNGVVEDDKGLLWISTNRGISRLNPETNEIKAYNLADELHDNEFNQGAVLKAADGRFYFGGLTGISAFYPDDIAQNNHVGNVLLTQITSEGRSLKFDVPLSELKEITLDHKDYLVTFEFAGLDFAQPDKNFYQYKLEGLDSDWVNIAHLNRATFTNLPSGSFVLKVRASNNDGVWSDDSINLKVKVLPAPWVSWWAIAIYGLLFGLVLLLIIRSQALRLANQELFKNQVSERVDEKTALYIKNNDFLKEQLEQLKFCANVDIETGLPNQKYLCELVKANLQWINYSQELTDKQQARLCVAIIRILPPNYHEENIDKVINRIIKDFSQQITLLDVNFNLLVRWGERELGLIYYAHNKQEWIDFIVDMSERLSELLLQAFSSQFNEKPVSIGYTMLPFSGVNQGAVDSDNIMMLTEHLSHLVTTYPDSNVVGISGANQKLNNVKFRQVMNVEKLTDLSEIFTLDKS